MPVTHGALAHCGPPYARLHNRRRPWTQHACLPIAAIPLRFDHAPSMTGTEHIFAWGTAGAGCGGTSAAVGTDNAVVGGGGSAFKRRPDLLGFAAIH